MFWEKALMPVLADEENYTVWEKVIINTLKFREICVSVGQEEVPKLRREHESQSQALFLVFAFEQHSFLLGQLDFSPYRDA